MAQVHQSPGVYREEIFLKAPPVLHTGVPALLGYAGPGPAGTSVLNQPVLLTRKEDFGVQFASVPDSFLADAVNGFFDNGGVRCYVVAVNRSDDPVKDFTSGIASLEALDDMDLIAVPDVMTLRTYSGDPDKPMIAEVHAEALAHCARMGNRVAILDSLPSSTPEAAMQQCSQLLVGQQQPVNGALYYPWLITTSNSKPVPPCGHVAGIYSLTDRKTGVFKAPANEEIVGVLDVETQIDNSIQDQLNPARVNCLRAFPGRGIRVWGARTIGSGESDPWLYVNVRRLFLTLRRWIDLNMGWATFEPNDGRLWVRIQRELTGYLTKWMIVGALRGSTPEQAFFVKCDAENNPPELRDVGQVVVDIGLAPLAPAEFIVVRIVRRAGATADD